MASAILPSRNQPNWSGYATKFTNTNINFTGLNPNTNPSHSHCFINDTTRGVFRKNHQQIPSSAPSKASFTGSSINAVPANSYGHRYITFRLGSYTKRELKELKKRLMSDLERVRMLRHWICSTTVPKQNRHPPVPEVLPAPEVALPAKESQKSAVGQKRTTPFQPVRDTKKQCGRVKNNARSKVVMRKCGQILAKLMKHKHGWVFNTPVDAVALKLYDYHSVIKNPMDLGTIKSKLGKSEYESPVAFASDVRLTFQNAMVYNGKGSDVFVMAERLLSLFEGLFDSANHKSVANQVKKQNRPPKVPIVEKTVPSAAANLGKPIAMDAKKREMTMEEKSELAGRLLNMQLGQQGMDEIMGIVKKRVLNLEHKGDEIELDLGVLDNETLWELHGFIGGLGKMEGMGREGGEEEVDIGEEIPVNNYPSVEIEKDDDGSSSSSSGSDSSSSDSDSSSEEESEQGEAKAKLC